jgi:hypothetical protein
MNEEDRQHVRILSLFHYVVGALAALFACFPIIHLVVGIGLVTGAFGHAADEPALRLIGAVFVALATILILCGWSLAVLLIVAGTFLRRQNHYAYCLVMAGVACAFFPFGTVLGVFTIVVLSRPTVRDAFGLVTAPVA